ncbi:type II toxin-antitoxin system VapC family toxin [Kumtagia ephedrae]|uniref:VapC toxin family PIN domain ribonuclease n=1 Tax=Kumtagia ephedrae TaxID=2116701 RepID=A0A2P7RZQ7_9HYPH|nr:type II toxin-antitoxin system VapC family toxin [Mesorhizobium ephedrae]PSJ55690.1 VapC toxin family PIN domain ribonuclease [Mesorhizobium ephedrae]
MAFALDTNVVSEMTRPTPDSGVVGWLERTPRSSLFLPSVVIAELYAGIEIMPQGKRRDSLAKFVSDFVAQAPSHHVLAFGLREAVHYAEIVASRRRIGREMKLLDAQIAAIAAANGFAVVTRNVRDFENCGVDIINPWAVS